MDTERMLQDAQRWVAATLLAGPSAPAPTVGPSESIPAPSTGPYDPTRPGLRDPVTATTVLVWSKGHVCFPECLCTDDTPQAQAQAQAPVITGALVQTAFEALEIAAGSQRA